MPSTYNATTTWTIIRDELLWVTWKTKAPLLNTIQLPADRLWCSAASAAVLQLNYKGKQLCADFIIIMIYYYDPSPAEQLVKPP